MWLLIAREPQPDAPYWPGRRWLAAADAVAWPVVWVIVARQLPQPTGVVGPFVMALAVLFGMGRLHRVVWVNHRYHFTTWRWGKFAAALVVVGLAMKLAMLR
jgi:hypothetical protein